jgi:hypothetical protein
MKRLLIFVAALSCAAACPALGEQYWIAYEGDDYPENEGWTRVYGDGNWPPEDEPDRWIEDGELVIDTSRDDPLWEYYQLPVADPGPGEMFVAEWRVRSEILSGPYDNTVIVARDASPGYVGVRFEAQGLQILNEDLVIPLDPGEPHAFRLESNAMDTYALWIDAQIAHIGFFYTDTLLQSFTGFGAGVQGASSISYWDYFRYGVVPEPTSVLLWAFAGLLAYRTRQRNR